MTSQDVFVTQLQYFDLDLLWFGIKNKPMYKIWTAHEVAEKMTSFFET